MRTCKQCGIQRPIDTYEFTNKGQYRLHTCRPCRSKRLNNHKKTLKGRRTAMYNRIFHNYGLTPDEYDGFILRSEGRCDICGKENPEPHLDHCHITDIVRGVLCNNCNYMLGNARDSRRILLAAVEYLSKY